jgi:hypothetical protein
VGTTISVEEFTISINLIAIIVFPEPVGNIIHPFFPAVIQFSIAFF